MFIVRYIPHRVMSHGADPITFVASDLDTELDFTPAFISHTVVGVDGQEYCSGSYDESGERWTARGTHHSIIHIKPIEFVN